MEMKEINEANVKRNVQVEAKGLRPFTTYNYQFTICGSSVKSPVGRTKTAPSPHANVPEVRLAVFSCSNYRESAKHICSSFELVTCG
jgi:alkaline phosphatase D